jgi:hypothetical protein
MTFLLLYQVVTNNNKKAIKTGSLAFDIYIFLKETIQNDFPAKEEDPVMPRRCQNVPAITTDADGFASMMA